LEEERKSEENPINQKNLNMIYGRTITAHNCFNFKLQKLYQMGKGFVRLSFERCLLTGGSLHSSGNGSGDSLSKTEGMMFAVQV